MARLKLRPIFTASDGTSVEVGPGYIAGKF